MQTWIALLRGINVGGKTRLPMAELRALLATLGHCDIRTYIQSGNCVFRSGADAPRSVRPETGAEIATEIEAAIERQFGFRPRILLLTRDALDAALDANPYVLEANSDHKSVHFYFLAAPAHSADLAALEAARKPNEAYTLTDSVFYLHAPDGIGRSKLAEIAEKQLGVPATARNHRTVTAVAELARS